MYPPRLVGGLELRGFSSAKTISSPPVARQVAVEATRDER
jgi:hypothetical protein